MKYINNFDEFKGENWAYPITVNSKIAREIIKRDLRQGGYFPFRITNLGLGVYQLDIDKRAKQSYLVRR